MKLWQKAYDVQQEIETFTTGKDRELDLQLAAHDVLGSLAHIKMLEKIGLLAEAELVQLEAALKVIYQNIKNGDFVIEAGIEDIHSQVELMLTRELGETGKKIHSGRSRNDQVLVDLKLFFREEIEDIVQQTEALFDTLLQKSKTHQAVLMPGYTHLQMAMVSSFGLWFGAYAETLIDDLRLLKSAYDIINQNPLGSAAGYGNSFPLDRTMTTNLLGFADLNYNVVHAQLGRGKTEQALSFALAAFGATLSKLAMDICLFNCQNFGFISFPDELTTGSSIMPHKKNPDVFELIRAKGNHLQALPATVSMLTGNLPSGYHRDYQLLKEIQFPALQDLKSILNMTDYMLQNIQVTEGLLDNEKSRFLYSVENVNDLVLQGSSFRDAYRKVAEEIEKDTFKPVKTLNHSHEGSLGNLCTEAIRRKMDTVLRSFPFDQKNTALQKLLN